MRLNYVKIANEGYKRLGQVLDYVRSSGLEESLLHLVYLRTSQINGCPYCVDLHWNDLVKTGMEHRKLNAVLIWRDTPFFSDRERAALAWAESVTRCLPEKESQPFYDEARTFFSEKELADLTIAIAEMNALNRLGIAFHITPR